jgi:hypothetical protein
LRPNWRRTITNIDSPDVSRAPVTTRRRQLSSADGLLISTCDTFYVITAAAATKQMRTPNMAGNVGMDTSHRGGLPGVIKVLSPTRLVWPDYVGNFLFNSLGNIKSDSRSALVFIDYNTGALLRVMGNVSVLRYTWRGASVLVCH